MSTIAEREIVIYATRGGQLKKITTDVQTWGELKPLVRAQGFDVDNLLAAEGTNKADLVNSQAILPAESFRLFLRPVQTKSGADALPYKEVRSRIQAIVARDGDKAKEHFNVDKNYTLKTTADLNALYASYFENSCVAEDCEAKAIPASKSTASTQTEAKDVAEEEDSSSRNVMDLNYAKDLILSITCVSTEKVLKHLDTLIERVTSFYNPPVETEEEKAARLRAEEEADLKRQAKEMGY